MTDIQFSCLLKWTFCTFQNPINNRGTEPSFLKPLFFLLVICFTRMCVTIQKICHYFCFIVTLNSRIVCLRCQANILIMFKCNISMLAFLNLHNMFKYSISMVFIYLSQSSFGYRSIIQNSLNLDLQTLNWSCIMHLFSVVAFLSQHNTFK